MILKGFLSHPLGAHLTVLDRTILSPKKGLGLWNIYRFSKPFYELLDYSNKFFNDVSVGQKVCIFS